MIRRESILYLIAELFLFAPLIALSQGRLPEPEREPGPEPERVCQLEPHACH